MNKKCDIDLILDNIHKKQFIILDSVGRQCISHDSIDMKFDCETKQRFYLVPSDSCEAAINTGRLNWEPCSQVLLEMDDCISQCIRRNTSQGKKLLERKAKMEERGWICVNTECQNPECILAPQKLVSVYEKWVSKQKAINERKRKEKLEQKNYICMLQCMSFIPGFIGQKRGNILSYEKSVIAHRKTKEKKEKIVAKNQRKQRHKFTICQKIEK